MKIGDVGVLKSRALLRRYLPALFAWPPRRGKAAR